MAALVMGTTANGSEAFAAVAVKRTADGIKEQAANSQDAQLNSLEITCCTHAEPIRGDLALMCRLLNCTRHQLKHQACKVCCLRAPPFQAGACRYLVHVLLPCARLAKLCWQKFYFEGVRLQWAISLLRSGRW